MERWAEPTLGGDWVMRTTTTNPDTLTGPPGARDRRAGHRSCASPARSERLTAIPARGGGIARYRRDGADLADQGLPLRESRERPRQGRGGSRARKPLGTDPRRKVLIARSPLARTGERIRGAKGLSTSGQVAMPRVADPLTRPSGTLSPQGRGERKRRPFPSSLAQRYADRPRPTGRGLG